MESAKIPRAYMVSINARHRRQCLPVVALVLASTALVPGSLEAAPMITSQCSTSATLLLPWACDDDGIPSVEGQGPFEWSLVTAPSDMFIENLTGEIFWAPQETGTYLVGLRVSDVAGETDEQHFEVQVDDAVAPRFAIEDGTPFDFAVGVLNWFTQEDIEDFFAEVAPTLKATGTPPFQFWADDSACLTVLPDGMYALASPIVGDCDVTMHVANWAGAHQITLPVHFSARLPSGATLEAVLTADQVKGIAPQTITFDRSESVVPAAGGLAGSFLNTKIFFSSGDPNDHLRPFPGTDMAWTYDKPGSYEARLVLWMKVQLSRSPFLYAASSVSLYSNRYEITVTREAVLPILISHDGLLPPQTTLIAEALAEDGTVYETLTGNAPLRVNFSSSTTLGDGKVKLVDGYVLNFGDDNERRPIIVGDFEDPELISHFYTQPGYYTAGLTVTAVDRSTGDPVTLTGMSSVNILVLDEGHAPPIARGTASPDQGEVPFEVQLFGQTGDTDGYVVSRHWVLPDGSTSTEAAPTFTVSEPGEYRARLIVTDNDMLVSDSVISIRGTRDGVLPPHIVSLPNRTAEVGYPYLYDYDSTPEATGGGPYKWLISKRLAADGSPAAESMTVDERTGELSWTPSTHDEGEIRITLTVENIAGVAAQSFVVTVTSPPVVPDAGQGVAVSRGLRCDVGQDEQGSGTTALFLFLLFLLRWRPRGEAS